MGAVILHQTQKTKNYEKYTLYNGRLARHHLVDSDEHHRHSTKCSPIAYWCSLSNHFSNRIWPRHVERLVFHQDIVKNNLA